MAGVLSTIAMFKEQGLKGYDFSNTLLDDVLAV